MNELETEMMALMHDLCAQIGPRPTGSTANQTAAERLYQAFAAHGLPVERQEFECPLWEEQNTSLWLDGECLPCGANDFSPPCDISAPLTPLGSLPELEAADLSGQLAVLLWRIDARHRLL